MSDSYLTFPTEDGTSVCWPNPNDPNDIGWKLRYAADSMTRGEQLIAASIVSAYFHLVNLDSRTRQLRVMQLRKAAS